MHSNTKRDGTDARRLLREIGLFDLSDRVQRKAAKKGRRDVKQAEREWRASSIAGAVRTDLVDLLI